MSKHVYNLKPDPKSDKDYLFKNLIIYTANKIPASIDLRPKCPTVKDQGQLGACTSFSACSVLEFLLNKDVDLSELYFYYQERKLDGDILEDNGSTIKQSANVAVKIGTCLESLDPYDVNKFTDTPTVTMNNDAKNHKARAYHRITTIDEIKTALGILGNPILIGVKLYDSFENINSDGIVPMPTKKESLLGGHAMGIYGYYTKKKTLVNKFLGLFSTTSKYSNLYFIVKNSWGTEFGDKGYVYMPATYLQKYGSDFWYLTD